MQKKKIEARNLLLSGVTDVSSINSNEPKGPSKEESRRFAWKRVLKRVVLYVIVIAAALLFFNREVTGNDSRAHFRASLITETS